MRITCPQCGFFREIPDNKVPVTSTMATCPKCRHRFKFRPDHEPETRSEPRPRAPLSSHAETESSWRRPGPAAARRVADSLPEDAPVRHHNPDSTTEKWRHVAAEHQAEEPAEPVASPYEDQPRHFRPVAPESGHPHDEDHQWPEELPGDTGHEPASYQPSGTRRTAREAAPDAFAEPPYDASDPMDLPRDNPPEFPPDVPEHDQLREPVDERRNQYRQAAPSQAAQAPEAEPGPREEPARPSQPQQQPDGVRDIWARLKAMDANKPARDAGAPRPDPGETETEEEAPRRETVTDPIPWERLDAYGFLPGLFLTLKKILFSPVEFFSAMPEGRPKGKALVFNLLISEFLLVLDFLWSLFGLRAQFGGTGEPNTLGTAASSPGLGLLIALLLVPLAIACGIYLDAWITHLLLLLFRSAKKGFNETFRVMCYSAAPTVLSAIPVAGQILSPVILVWYMTLQAIGLKKAHDAAYTQTLAAIFIKWSLYLFLLLAMLQNFTPGS